MRIAYEDVRIAPQGMLAKEMVTHSLEEVLGYYETLSDGEERGIKSGNINGTKQTAHPIFSTETESTRGHAHVCTALEDPDLKPTYSRTLAVGSMLAYTDTSTGAEKEIKHARIRPVMPAKPFDPKKDIGIHTERVASNSVPSLKNMESEKRQELEDVHKIYEAHQVSGGKLDFTLPWLLEQAFEKEHDSNWVEAYGQVGERDIPAHANVITSHVVYKLKTDEIGNRDLKARIVPHGNHDAEKDEIRKDSSTAQLFVIRLLFSVVTFLGFRLRMADIKGAYLQSGPITREIFVQPPRKWTGPRGTLWKLTKIRYGIVEAGRQWQKTIEDYMPDTGKLERVFGIGDVC